MSTSSALSSSLFTSLFTSLYSPSSSSPTSSLTGIRALLTIWIVSFHILWYMNFYLPKHIYLAFFSQFAVLTSGYIAVDVFFILTGFLLSYPIFLKNNFQRKYILAFIYKRLIRIWPLYITVIIIYCTIVFPNGIFPLSYFKEAGTVALIHMGNKEESMFPTSCNVSIFNILFINNFIPFGGCMGWTWSLAIQGQFYIGFPMVVSVLGMKSSLRYFIYFVLIFTTLLRCLSYYLFLGEPLGVTVYDVSDIEPFFKIFYFFYSNSFTRFGSLYWGVLLARLSISEVDQTMENSECGKLALWLNTNPKGKVYTTVFAGLNTAIFFYIVYAIREGWFGSSPFFTIFMGVGGILFNLVVSYMIFTILFAVGLLGKYIKSLLSMSFWEPIATLSYAIYLVHPAVLYYSYSTFLYPISVGWDMFAFYFVINWTLILLVSLGCFYLIELPASKYLK